MSRSLTIERVREYRRVGVTGVKVKEWSKVYLFLLCWALDDDGLTVPSPRVPDW